MAAARISAGMPQVRHRLSSSGNLESRAVPVVFLQQGFEHRPLPDLVRMHVQAPGRSHRKRPAPQPGIQKLHARQSFLPASSPGLAASLQQLLQGLGSAEEGVAALAWRRGGNSSTSLPQKVPSSFAGLEV